MISAKSGLPGSGKSYSAVVDNIIPALAIGRTVYTNLEVNADRFEAEGYPGKLHHFDTQDALADFDFFSKLPAGILLVLDEVYKFWPAGLKANDAATSQRNFLAEHRHKVNAKGENTDILYMCPDLAQVSAFARQLVEITNICVKLSAVGLRKQYRIETYQGCVTGLYGPKLRLLSTSLHRYNSKYFGFYRSHTQAVAGAVGDEKGVEKRTIIWKSPIWLAGLVLVIVCASFGVYEFHNLFSGKQFGSQSSKLSSQKSKVLTAVAVAQDIYSHVWRLGGVIFSRMISHGGYALVTSTDGVVRTLPISFCRRYPSDTDWACVVDHKIVTAWSGVPAPVISTASPAFPPCKQALTAADRSGIQPSPIGSNPFCATSSTTIDLSSSGLITTPQGRPSSGAGTP